MTPSEMKALFNSMSTEEQDSFIAELSDEEVDSFLSQMQGVAPEKKGFLDKALEAAAPALSTAGKVLDYAGGVARTTAAAPLMESVGVGDVLDALMAKPLSGAEILERGGMPESGKLSDVLPQLYSDTGEGLALQRGGWADPTGRGAAGLALEMAADPLTYLSLGLTKGAGAVTKKAGESAYRSGLKSADRALELVGKGKKGFSDTAMKYGFAGSAEDIAEQASKKAAELAAERSAILEDLSVRGAKVDVADVLTPLKKEIQSIKGKPTTVKPVRRAVESFEKNYLDDLIERTGGPKDEIKMQGEFFNPEDLPVDEKVRQLVVEPEVAQKGVSELRQQRIFPEGATSASPGVLSEDKLEILPETLLESETRRQVIQGSSLTPRKGVDIVELEGKLYPTQTNLFGNPSTQTFPDRSFAIEVPAQPGVYTGPEQAMLFPESQTASLPFKNEPNIYTEIGRRAKLQPGQQTSLFTAGEIPFKAPERGVSVLDAADLNTSLYDQLSSNTWQNLGKNSPSEKLLKKAARANKEAIESAAKKVDPEAARRLAEIQSDLGNILSSQKVLQNETSKEIAKNALTSVDALLAPINPAAAASKKVADVLKGTSARTKGGKALQDFGTYLQNKQANPYQFLMKEAVRQQGDNNE